MPPKVLFSKEEIVSSAVMLVRSHGIDGLTARSLAAALHCSVKPIFGYFSTMEELKNAVIAAANEIYLGYLKNGVKSDAYPPYKATGMAYILFARNERELFKLLFMRDRTGEPTKKADETEALIGLIMKGTGLSKEQAYLLHLETWIFVHGIATMIATGYLVWDEEFISRALTDCYRGLIAKFKDGQKDDSQTKTGAIKQ